MPSICFQPALTDGTDASSPYSMTSTLAPPSIARFGEWAKFLPVCLVTVCMAYLWLVYMCCHCRPLLEDDETFRTGWWHLVTFNVLSFFVFSCYARAILQHPGTVPEFSEDGLLSFDKAEDARKKEALEVRKKEAVDRGDCAEVLRVTKQLQTQFKPPPFNKEAKNKGGDRRVCKWCNKYKPDRTHHCRVCRICILKMDHHCPWIYNCVGFKNYKFFFLTILYSVIDCHFIVWTSVENLSQIWTNDRTPILQMFAILFCVTLAGFFGFILLAFLSFHLYLMYNAITTIEFCENKIDRDNSANSGYSLGLLGNIQASLGDNPLWWLFPIRGPSGSGLLFKNKKDLEKERRLDVDGRRKQLTNYGSVGQAKGKAASSQEAASSGKAPPPAERAPPVSPGTGETRDTRSCSSDEGERASSEKRADGSSRTGVESSSFHTASSDRV